MNNLVYGNGQVDIGNNESIVALQIHYEGFINCNSVMPDEFLLYKNKKKIIIYSMELHMLPSILFEYNGQFKITKCIASNINGEKVKVNVKNNYLGFWSKQDSIYENIDFKWEEIKGNNLVGNKVSVSKDILPNLTKEQKKTIKQIKNNKKLRGY
jgi:hypothetical protein